jgi:hypothetical protein
VLKFVRTIFETDARVVAVPEVVTAVAPNTANQYSPAERSALPTGKFARISPVTLLSKFAWLTVVPALELPPAELNVLEVDAPLVSMLPTNPMVYDCAKDA